MQSSLINRLVVTLMWMIATQWKFYCPVQSTIAVQIRVQTYPVSFTGVKLLKLAVDWDTGTKENCMTFFSLVDWALLGLDIFLCRDTKFTILQFGKCTGLVWPLFVWDFTYVVLRDSCHCTQWKPLVCCKPLLWELMVAKNIHTERLSWFFFLLCLELDAIILLGSVGQHGSS